MRIAVDVMGGERGPLEVVKGSIEAAREYKVEIALVGREAIIQQQLAKCRPENSKLSIVNAVDVVNPHEPPAQAIRHKPDSSIVVGMNLLKGGDVSAFVSAGHSGAMVAAALFILGRIKGIERPALGAIFPTPSDPVLVLDIGANADCRPSFLIQFAEIGSIYMERVLGVHQPRVGLLSCGEEEIKGNRLVRESHKLFKKSKLNFVGNVEGKDIHRGVADVIVTDGFTGNIVLKTSEGFSEAFFDMLEQALASRPHFKVVSLLLDPALRAFARRLDYSEYGGAPLLGVNGNVVIAHGRSQAKAIKNAVGLAKRAVEQGMPQAITGGSYGQTD